MTLYTRRIRKVLSALTLAGAIVSGYYTYEATDIISKTYDTPKVLHYQSLEKKINDIDKQMAFQRRYCSEQNGGILEEQKKRLLEQKIELDKDQHLQKTIQEMQGASDRAGYLAFIFAGCLVSSFFSYLSYKAQKEKDKLEKV